MSVDKWSNMCEDFIVEYNSCNIRICWEIKDLESNVQAFGTGTGKSEFWKSCLLWK